jgi:hypothetical protein
VWGGTTYVDFDGGLNTAINKLRRALDDSAEKPRFIETVPGRGYRFVGLLEHRDTSPIPAIKESMDRSEPRTKRTSGHWWWLAALVACFILFSVWWRQNRLPVKPRWWRYLRSIILWWRSPPVGKGWIGSRLTFGGNPYQIDMLDVASHRRTPLFIHSVYNLLYGHFSPDGRWVSFTVRVQPNHSRIVIAPVDGPRPVPESAWIKITEEGAEDWADWSPDGKTLYFTSGRDGHTCLWGQQIEVNSHKPSGAAFAIKHFHGRAFYPQGGGWSAAGDRIAVVLSEDTGNVWLMSRSAKP